MSLWDLEPTPVDAEPTTVVEAPVRPPAKTTFVCPRCSNEVTENFYGPCYACRLELRIDAEYHDFTPKVVVIPELEPDPELDETPPPAPTLVESGDDLSRERAAMAATKAATEAAIAQVDENADEAWKAAALEAIRLCALEHTEFTADEVWVRLAERPDLSTHEPAALGPVFLRAARAGWIHNTDRRRKRSILAQRHRELTIWASLLQQP